MPDELEYIGSYAFLECRNLSAITLPDGLTYYGKGVFEGCFAQDSEGEEGNYRYEILANSFAVLTRYNGSDEELVLPKTLAGYPITEIGPEAFSVEWDEDDTLKQIVLPDSVLRIGNSAFAGRHHLSKVIFPAHLISIEDYAFAYCDELTGISLPASLIDCGHNVFENCVNVPDISDYEGGIQSILSQIKKECGDYEYYLLSDSLAILSKYTGNAEILVLPESLDGYPLYGIDRYAFAENETLKSIQLPKSLREIDAESFADCYALRKITFTEHINNDMAESLRWNCISDMVLEFK